MKKGLKTINSALETIRKITTPPLGGFELLDLFTKDTTPPSSYNPNIAIDYAKQWADPGRSKEENHNPKYRRYDVEEDAYDCANFGSQIVHESGFPMTEEWYYDEKTGFASDAWRIAHEHYKYFSNENNGYIEGEEIVVTSLEKLDKIYQSKVVERGDLLYWDFKGDGDIDHTTVISSVDGELKYTGHTQDVFDESVKRTFKKYLREADEDEKPTLHIVRLKKEAPRHKEPGLADKVEDMAIYYSERAFWNALKETVEFLAGE